MHEGALVVIKRPAHYLYACSEVTGVWLKVTFLYNGVEVSQWSELELDA